MERKWNYRKVLLTAFIGIFMALLLLPNTGLKRHKENAAAVAKENRKISPFPQASVKIKAFYTNFEKWYQDRLRYRAQAIEKWKRWNFAAGVVLKDNIVIGKNDWLLNKNGIIKKYNDGGIKMQRLVALQEYCRERGLGFILLLPPNKEAVYRDYFPQGIRERYEPYSFFEKQLETDLQKAGINYLSVTDALLAARKESKNDLYFNDDHHWSYYGSAIGAALLLKELAVMTPKLRYSGLPLDGLEREAYKECSYWGQLGFNLNFKTKAPWSKSFAEEIYLRDCYTNKESKINEPVSNNKLWSGLVNGENIILNKACSNGLRILVLGDSYSSYMMPYLSQYAQMIISTHYRSKAGKKKDTDMKRLLAQYKPDIVVLEVLGETMIGSVKDEIFKNIMLK